MSAHYVEYTLPGAHAPAAALSALGALARGGLVVRVTATPAETRVVLAYSARHAATPVKAVAAFRSRPVTEVEVRKIG